MLRQLSQLFMVLMREFYRQPAILFWGFGFPLLTAWGLGVAFSQKNELQRNIAFEGSESQFRSAYTSLNPGVTLPDNLKEIPFNISFVNQQQAELLYKQGKILLTLKHDSGKWKYHYDPLNADGSLAYYQLNNWLEQGVDYRQPLPQLVPVNKKGSRYVDFLIPGLVGMGIMFSCMWGTCYSLIDKRSKKLLRRIFATPMNPMIFFFAHMATRLVIALSEALVLILFAWVYFGTEIQGSLPALAVVLCAGIFCFVSLALFTSSRTANTQIGNGLLNLVTLPMMVCSGIFFSYHNFPEWVQPYIAVLPLTLVNDAARAVFNEGAVLADVMGPVMIMLGMGVVLLPITVRIYKWY